jgi:haloalkane dehalogenase
MIVPLEGKAKGFHITGANSAEFLSKDIKPNAFDAKLLANGVGIVKTVVKPLAQIPGKQGLGQEMGKLFLKDLNPRYTNVWIWSMTLMRATTAAYAEVDHFENGKVAGSGGSKNGISPATALINDERFTATCSKVAFAWASPTRKVDRNQLKKVNAANEAFFESAKAGEFELNRQRARWYQANMVGSPRSLPALALNAGKSWDELAPFADHILASLCVTEHWDRLRQRGVDMLFEPGTHDYVAYDILWGAQNHPQLPVYYAANGGHKQQRHDATETDSENLEAFLWNHFFGGEPLLKPPNSNHEIDGDKLHVRVRFDDGPQAESGRLWWIYDRAPAGSAPFLHVQIPEDQWVDMKRHAKTGAWTATIPLKEGASRIDFFSNHGKVVNGYQQYLSSPYTRVELSPAPASNPLSGEIRPGVFRTPDERFENLEDYPFKPHYLEVDSKVGKLRMHYVDEGPRDAEPILLMHGEPSWSYLYRKMIPPLVAAGHRVIAPDLIGFGRSDKPAKRSDHSYQNHVDWMMQFVTELELENVTLFCQDWGSLIGLRLVTGAPDRFARVVAGNAALPAGPGDDGIVIGRQWTQPDPNAELKWEGGFMRWLKYSQTVPKFDCGPILQIATVRELAEAEMDAYRAPFPDERYLAGPRVMPTLVRSQMATNRKAWKVLAKFDKPFLTTFSDRDPITKGGEKVFQKRVPGANGQPHTIVKNASHFLQEDAAEQLATLINDLIAANPTPAAERQAKKVGVPAATDLRSHGVTQDQIESLSEILRQAVEQEKIAGCSFLLAHKGEVVFRESFGYADLESERPFTTAELIPIASVSKPFLASVFMVLVEQGKLKLDDPVENYLPEFKGMKVEGSQSPARPMTIRHLLSHTGGFWGNKGITPEKRDLIRNFERPLADAVKRMAEYDLVYEPGTKYLYSGSGYCVAGRVAEVALGRSLEEIAQDALFRPLGLNRTTFLPSKELRGAVPTAYLRQGGTLRRQPSMAERELRFILPGGSLFTTLDDMAVFGQMHLNDGVYNGKRILSMASVTEMRRLQIPEERQRAYGLGWFRGDVPESGLADLVFHGGALGAHFRIDRRREVVCAFLVHQTAIQVQGLKEKLVQHVEEMFPVANGNRK